MSAWQPRKGSREVDRIVPGIGRVRLRTGTKDARRAEAYDRLLDDLPLDVVRLLQGRQVTLRELYDRRVAGKPLPTADELHQLLPALDAWLARPLRSVTASWQKQRKAFVAKLKALERAPQLAELPSLCRRLYVVRRDAEQHAAWNREKAIALAFLRDTVGRASAVYDAVRELPSLHETPTQTRHPCTVAEAREIARALGSKWGPQWWTLCLTGMEPKEHYVDGWRVLSHGVEIHGRKRPARERIVPVLGTLVQHVGTYWGFQQVFQRMQLGVTALDARRSYSRWLEEAGLPAYRRSAYMGHGPKSMRELYPWGDIKAWLSGDMRALRQVLGEPALQVERA